MYREKEEKEKIMNRRDRRKTSKRLGILDYQKRLPRNKRFELIRENIIAGKAMHEENVKNAYLRIEEREHNRMYAMAEDLAKRKDIPFMDALEEIEKTQKEQKEKNQNKDS